MPTSLAAVVKLLVTLAFVLGASLAVVYWTVARGSEPAETRETLDGVVVGHVGDLLADRYDAAWSRIHVDDREAVGRELWERCKRSPDVTLAAVRYGRIRVTGEKPMTFDSRLHQRLAAIAVTVNVRAVMSGVSFDVRDVSHWAVDQGRWARLVEPQKLAAYTNGRCPR